MSISIRHSESTSSCRMGVAFANSAQFTQFIFRHHQFRCATVQANNELWEYPDSGLVNVFESGRTDAHLPDEHLLVYRSARFAFQTNPLHWVTRFIPNEYY
jgi:hypothetical protein